jgi:hypothetical protein
MDVRKVNDQSLEWLIFVTRWLAVVAALGALALLTLAAIRVQQEFVIGYVVGAAVLAGAACLAGYLGWYRLGNADWPGEPSRGAVICGAYYQGMVCNVEVDERGLHTGDHQDGVRDPEGARTWM